jgi:hypothetical protein
MNTSRHHARSLAAALALASAASPALAVNVVSGDLWHVPDSVAQHAIPSNVPSTMPDVTFEVDSPLDFTQPGPIQTFLNSGGAFNIVEHTPGTLASPISNGVISTIITFNGVVSVTNGQMFTVTHDDGLTLIIGGVNLGFNSGPTAPTTSTATYTGPTGTFPFQLVYGECCGGSAVLQVDLPFSNAPVPEPESIALLSVGLAALALRARKRRTVVSS